MPRNISGLIHPIDTDSVTCWSNSKIVTEKFEKPDSKQNLMKTTLGFLVNTAPQPDEIRWNNVTKSGFIHKRNLSNSPKKLRTFFHIQKKLGIDNNVIQSQ